MKTKCSPLSKIAPQGFTIIEMLIASTILLVVVVAALSIYSRSNKSAVDQQMYAAIQNDVRSAIYLVSRYVRSTGVGFNTNIAGYFIEGTDSYGPGSEAPDSLKIMGNFDDPMNLIVDHSSGSSATVFLEDSSFAKSPYICPDDYVNKTYMIVSTQCPGCFAMRYAADNSVYGCGSGIAHINFSPGLSELNPPGGLSDTGCIDDCWNNSILTIGQIKLFWLDTTGNPSDYAGLSLSVGQDGYLGIPYTLYVTGTNPDGTILHMPLAMNIESLQFQYNGDLDQDGVLDGFTDWDNANWTINPGDDSSTKQTKMDLISRIRLVRIWVLGRTPRAYVSIGRGSAPAAYNYRRPAVANVGAAGADDFHRRFLLESTAAIRNLSLNLYNAGVH